MAEGAPKAAAVPTYQARTYPSDLTKFRYLVLEGGGGAGNAYVGAFRALQKEGILKYSGYRVDGMRGFAGSSAGALTALFLSCGYDPDEIAAISKLEDFTRFFDTVGKGWVPELGGFVRRGISVDQVSIAGLRLDVLDLLMLYVALASSEGAITAKSAAAGIGPLLGTLATRGLGALLDTAATNKGGLLGLDNPEMTVRLKKLTAKLFETVARTRAEAKGKPIGEGRLPSTITTQLTDNPKEAVESLVSDYGIFPGERVRQFFLKWVTLARVRVNKPTAFGDDFASLTDADNRIQRMSSKWSSALDLRRNPGFNGAALNVGTWMHDAGGLTDAEYEHWQEASKRGEGDAISLGTTFANHAQAFGALFMATGSNLSTQRTELFSCHTTPGMFVEDAARISMSLPLIYKPYIIRDATGLTVGNSVPEVVDLDYQGVWVDGGLYNNTPVQAFDPYLRPGEHVLTLRLGEDAFPDKILERGSLGGYLGTGYPLPLVGGAGETQLSASLRYDPRVFVVPTGTLDLLSFDAKSKEVEDAQKEAMTQMEKQLKAPYRSAKRRR